MKGLDPPGAAAPRSLERARRRLIVRRLPLFAAAWLGATVVWTIVLLVERLLTPWMALVLPSAQTAMLGLALACCRADPVAARVRTIVVTTIVLLGVSSTAVFAALGGGGDMLAFLLLILYLSTSLFFAWGWRTALLVLVATVIPWLAANPMLRFSLPTVELVAAICVGSIVCLGLAEVSSRGFGTAFVRGAREQEATRQLAASRDAYRDLAENASDLIYTHDLEGRLTYVNEAFARFAGAPLDAIVGRLSRELVVHMPETPDIPAIIARVAAGELVPPQIFPVESATGFRWIECAISAIRDSSDRVTGIRGIARDVTARRDAEERLRASLAELRDSEERLRLLAQRQAMIREEERKRIGFDLHDDVCQELVGIGIILESLRRGAGASSMESARDLERIGRYLNEVVEHLRLLAHDLRPLLLRDLGLEGSLRSLADGMSSPATRIIATFATAVPRLAEEAEIGVYRIAQEALVNAARHAGAGRITITLRILDATLHLDVRDDGCGFVAEDRQRRPNLGLVGMQERALALGGRLAVWSEPGKGTAVHLECPVLGCAPASAA